MSHAADRQGTKGVKRPVHPDNVFHIARDEIRVAAIVADMRKKCVISEVDSKRLNIVGARLAAISQAAYGR